MANGIEPYLERTDRWYRTGETGDGSFATALYDLCSKADSNNLAKLLDAFPGPVGAWCAYNIMSGQILEHIDSEKQYEVLIDGGKIQVYRLPIHKQEG